MNRRFVVRYGSNKEISWNEIGEDKEKCPDAIIPFVQIYVMKDEELKPCLYLSKNDAKKLAQVLNIFAG